MNRGSLSSLRPIAAVGAGAALALGVGAMAASAKPHPHGHGNGTGSSHNSGAGAPSSTPRQHVFATGDTLTNPDDITSMDGRIFVAWQNQTTPTGGGGDSTVVAYRNNGKPAGSWSIPGHVDGLTADPAHHRLIATANEDANSALYTITPHGGKHAGLLTYTYTTDGTNPATLPGGTDAISIVNGKVLISASNPPGTTPFTSAAVYQATIPSNGSLVLLTPYFNDNSQATVAGTTNTVTMNLSDPDSNTVVPQSASMFGGDFMLVSQADSQLVFAADQGSSAPSLTLLNLNAGSASAPQVDDVRWTTSPHGTLFVTDGAANKVYAITGSFGKNTVLTAIPSDSPSLAGDIGSIDLSTGTVTPIVTGFQSPKGLLYLPGHAGQAGAPHDHGH